MGERELFLPIEENRRHTHIFEESVHMSPVKSFHLHLVSDATGETIGNVVRACLVQFENITTQEHNWFLIRSEAQIGRVLEAAAATRGVVLFTLVNSRLRKALENGCRKLKLPCIPVLDPVMGALRGHLGIESQDQPGRQHALDEKYYHRLDAMSFALLNDDGQHAENLNNADVVLVGASRTTKTPTCIYLANRGLRAANVPIVPGAPLLETVGKAVRPLVVGLTMDPSRLAEARQSRLPESGGATGYTDFESVREEVLRARRIFSEHGWPVIDVTRRAIEETASAILQLYTERRSVAAHE